MSMWILPWVPRPHFWKNVIEKNLIKLDLSNPSLDPTLLPEIMLYVRDAWDWT